MQRLLQAAENQRDAINRELHIRPTSTGVRYRLLWQPLSEEEGAPVGLEAARKRLLNVGADLWSAEDRRVVGAMLQQRIAAERERADAGGGGDGGSLIDQLARALDYRHWHRFRVERWQDGHWRKLSGPASSGERALGLTVPLFAAVASFYRQGSYALAPRLMLLDEAFAGIDDAARAHCMGLIREFDLDFVITSEREWACYAELPGVAICQLQRREGIDAVFVSRWTWDGRARDSRRRSRPEVCAGMSTADERLRRILGGDHLVSLRKRLRQRFERAPVDGSVESFRLGKLSIEEHAALSHLLGRPQRYSSSLTIDVGLVDAAFQNAGIAASLRDALERLDGPIAHLATDRLKVEMLWSEVIAGCDHPLCAALLRIAPGLGLLRRLSRQSPSAAAELCRRAEAVLRRLPAQGVTRSQLAADVLGDAHALDGGQPTATLVLAALRLSLHRRDERLMTRNRQSDDGSPRRDRDTWAKAGVLVNELARPVLSLNLPTTGSKERRPSTGRARLRLSAIAAAFPAVLGCRRQDGLRLREPQPAGNCRRSLGSRLCALVCTDGMPAAAQRCLLSQLAKARASLCYHGDFDWPGLRIGNHVMREYGARPWRFGAADYENAARRLSRS